MRQESKTVGFEGFHEPQQPKVELLAKIVQFLD
jgi:hypothetical protein